MGFDTERRYFMMSKMYHVITSGEFGLDVSTDNPRVYTSREDGSSWEERSLYDFGWGPEVGFVRLPMLGFEELWELLEKSSIEDNRYGAASVILKDFPDQLLSRAERLMHRRDTTHEVASAVAILRLGRAENRSDPMGKPPEEVRSDYRRWSAVAIWARNLRKG